MNCGSMQNVSRQSTAFAVFLQDVTLSFISFTSNVSCSERSFSRTRHTSSSGPARKRLISRQVTSSDPRYTNRPRSEPTCCGACTPDKLRLRVEWQYSVIPYSASFWLAGVNTEVIEFSLSTSNHSWPHREPPLHLLFGRRVLLGPFKYLVALPMDSSLLKTLKAGPSHSDMQHCWEPYPTPFAASTLAEIVYIIGKSGRARKLRHVGLS